DCETEFMAEYIWIENEGETHNPDNPPIHSSDDMVKLMQYTGLKDKNGTEIYEGDIIKSKHKQGGKVYRSEEKSTYLIYWFEEEYNTFLQVAKDGEVIGNIYEHPHLLGDNNAR